jgi:hypothetical protein
VVFPGRLCLHPPSKDSDERKKEEDTDPEVQDQDTTAKSDGQEDTKKKPFAPTNPPQHFGTIHQGPNHTLQLTIPFPDNRQLI